jgi:hypothetical protein
VIQCHLSTCLRWMPALLLVMSGCMGWHKVDVKPGPIDAPVASVCSHLKCADWQQVTIHDDSVFGKSRDGYYRPLRLALADVDSIRIPSHPSPAERVGGIAKGVGVVALVAAFVGGVFYLIYLGDVEGHRGR